MLNLSILSLSRLQDTAGAIRYAEKVGLLMWILIKAQTNMDLIKGLHLFPRGAGGSFGKKEKAIEDQYFHNLVSVLSGCVCV